MQGQLALEGSLRRLQATRRGACNIRGERQFIFHIYSSAVSFKVKFPMTNGQLHVSVVHCSLMRGSDGGMLTPTELKKRDYFCVHGLEHFDAFTSVPGTLIHALSQQAESAQSSVPGRERRRRRWDMIRMYQAEATTEAEQIWRGRKDWNYILLSNTLASMTSHVSEAPLTASDTVRAVTTDKQTSHR